MFDFSITFFIFSFFTFLFKLVFHLNLKLIVQLLGQLLRLENTTRTFFSFFLTYLYYCVLWNCVLGSFILFPPPIYNALPLETKDFFKGPFDSFLYTFKYNFSFSFTCSFLFNPNLNWLCVLINQPYPFSIIL